MNEQFFIIFQITYSTILTAAIGWISVFAKRSVAKVANDKKADMLILRYVLIQMHDIYMSKGFIPDSSLTTFEEIWDLYHTGYGGNLLTDRFHDEVKNLQIIRG